MFAGSAEGDIVKQHAVLTDFSGFADHDSRSMIDKEAFADGRAGMNFHPGQKMPDFGNQARDKRNTKLIQRMNDAMNHYRVESGIQQKLDIFRRRIIAINGPDIFFYSGKNHIYIDTYRSRRPLG